MNPAAITVLLVLLMVCFVLSLPFLYFIGSRISFLNPFQAIETWWDYWDEKLGNTKDP